MEKNITFTIQELYLGGKVWVTTRSPLADAGDRDIEISRIGLLSLMMELSDKYNNHPAGCIGVYFVCE